MSNNRVRISPPALKQKAGERGNNINIRKAFELYRTDFIVFKNQSKRTEEAHMYVAKSLIDYLGNIDLKKLSFDKIRDWKIDLEKTRSPDTVRVYIIRLRVVLSYLHNRGENCMDGSNIPVPKTTDKVPQYITKEQVAQLLKSTDVPRSCKLNRLRNKAIISMLYASGIRVSELCSLDVEDIKGTMFTVVGKNGKARLCFIDHRTQNFLNNYLSLRNDGNHALFISNENKKRITKGNVQFIFRCCSKRTGIACHPHTLRHSFATNLLKNNCNMRYVQDLLGHQSLQTTQKYTHVVNRDLEKVYAQYHTV